MENAKTQTGKQSTIFKEKTFSIICKEETFSIMCKEKTFSIICIETFSTISMVYKDDMSIGHVQQQRICCTGCNA